MTEQHVVLAIAFLVGAAMSALLLRAAVRRILPGPALVIAVLAVPAWLIYFSSARGRTLLAAEGLRHAVPEALLVGAAFGAFTAAFFLALGYVYADARRRGMPAWAWVAAAFFIPNCIGFILYFLFRSPLLEPCVSCGKSIRRGEAFCSQCGCPQESSTRSAAS